MRKSIKFMVGVRVAVALLAVLLYSFMMTANILYIEKNQKVNARSSELLNQVHTAKAAHYRWAANLSNALYAGTEFTGSLDPTTCVLGQWLYNDQGIEDELVLSLRSQIEPLHRELHQSASTALSMTPSQGQTYYQDTIQGNLTTLVGLLDQVVDRETFLNEGTSHKMRSTILFMHSTSVVGLAICLVTLISLVMYVIKRVLKPILLITDGSRPLQEGKLNLKLHYDADDEIGDLARTLEESMKQIHQYVDDINRMMEELSAGNFDVHTSTTYVGDFRTIQEAMDSFTTNISTAFGHIQQAEQRVSGNAEQLSSSSQSLAQGATEQASEIEGLYSTLDSLSKSAANNVRMASAAQEGARMTGDQVTVSSRQMDEMVAAMSDISAGSQQIGRIIATIENIAFQTNILALNAAVEAARAGAAGKGFAVVADEVRSLATQSDQAAKATKELIEDAMKATNRGSRIVGEVSETLKKMMDLVMESNNAIGEIAQAVEAEASSIAQVADGIGQISSVVQTNSASSQEAAAVSSELFEQVHLLQDQTKRFHLKRG